MIKYRWLIQQGHHLNWPVIEYYFYYTIMTIYDLDTFLQIIIKTLIPKIV